MATTQLSPTTGIEITGLRGADLTRPGAADECRALLDSSGVVIYREIDVSDADLVAFSRVLGEVVVSPMGADPVHPEITAVTRDASKSVLAAYREGTFFWHLDGATSEVPEKATLLTARELSDDDGGDTEFANTYAAWASLPEDEQQRLRALRVVHSFAASQRLANPDAPPEEQARWERRPAQIHPLVWTRADGRTSMLLGATADHVEGMDRDEGRALLDDLLERATQPDFVVRHRWRLGDLAVWDNTGMLHRALPYGPGSSRLMHRTTLQGEEAVA